MPASDDLINFDIIENEKENIQSLPGGHSVRALANVFSPSPLNKSPTPCDTKNLNDTMRQEFESEILCMSESDDPLDIFDRYVRWTLDSYPSAQATPSSQLLPLLERATKAFLNSTQYKNDPRYLKLWLSYINLVSDAPREAFLFLARHNIGEYLALFYEEFAAWLEGAGRLRQAEEIYKLGIDKEARPTARLLRKFNEFQKRCAQRPVDINQPSSPALSTVRPALAAKVDPFDFVLPRDPQVPVPNAGFGGSSRGTRQKLQVFSDSENAKSGCSVNNDVVGWQSIGSLTERKKENTLESKSWAGETLRAGGGKSVDKIPIFKDKSIPQFSYSQILDPAQHQITMNQKGRRERIFVNLEALYPTPEIFGSELSIEELRARQRGWLSKSWKPEACIRDSIVENPLTEQIKVEDGILRDELIQALNEKLVLGDSVTKEQSRDGRARRMKIKQVNETQIIKAKLSSPSGPKIMKRKPKEPTMTLHTKAATDDIYDLFNQPLRDLGEFQKEDEESSDDDNMTDGDYTSGGESSCTGRLATISDEEIDETSDLKNPNEWTEFSPRKHLPDLQSNNGPMREIKSSHDGKVKSKCQNQIKTLVASSSSESHKDEDLILRPVLSENFQPPSQPYLDPNQISSNYVPLMTPIAERTESSLALITSGLKEKDNSHAKTLIGEPRKSIKLASPHRNRLPMDFVQQNIEPGNTKSLLQNSLNIDSNLLAHVTTEECYTKYSTFITKKSVIIKDAQCNPTNLALRKSILACVQPPLHTYQGFFSYTDKVLGKTAEIKKFIKTASKANRKGVDKTTKSIVSPVLQFPGSDRQYVVKRELGAGTFAPVYLLESIILDKKTAENSSRQFKTAEASCDINYRRSSEALKMEHEPSAWEFYIMRQAGYRLGMSRTAESVTRVHEMHLFKDECYLIEDYRDQGTLLNVINIVKEDKSGPGVMEESLVMFFAIELFRTIEELHSRGILHGDLKADNCLIRFDPLDENEVWSSCYRKDGSEGWNKKGICLIDFGRGIDMYVFSPQVQFIADWESTPQDCAEIREMRPWTYQIDYYGLAGIIHSMLFGKYIDTVADNRNGVGPGAKKTWRLRENLKRYWQSDIWAESFDLLLNATSHTEDEENCKMPVTRGLRVCREKMEAWLEANTERSIRLHAGIRKLESLLNGKK